MEDASAGSMEAGKDRLDADWGGRFALEGH